MNREYIGAAGDISRTEVIAARPGPGDDVA
jgi:hypothetical protein